MTCFSGIWVPLVTPFRDGNIDRPAFQALAREIANAGVAGLVICGSTGEAAALSEPEQLMLLDAAIESVPGFPVVMGLAGNNLIAMRAMLEQIQRRDIAGILVPPPYFIRPSQAGVVEYFHALANAATVPVILYNIPYRTGITLDLDTLRTIAMHERIVAIKDCCGDPAITMSLIADANLDVLAGEDAQIFSTLCLGAKGAIAASAHIRPDLFVRLVHLVEAGELEQARVLFFRLLPLMRTLFEEPNPGPLKAALSIQGIIRDGLRPPMQPASDKIKIRLAGELSRLTDLIVISTPASSTERCLAAL